ncbi:MAG: hypothetical protein ABJ246_21530 [Paracoccaceae bacterium]
MPIAFVKVSGIPKEKKYAAQRMPAEARRTNSCRTKRSLNLRNWSQNSLPFNSIRWNPEVPPQKEEIFFASSLRQVSKPRRACRILVALEPSALKGKAATLGHYRYRRKVQLLKQGHDIAGTIEAIEQETVGTSERPLALEIFQQNLQF